MKNSILLLVFICLVTNSCISTKTPVVKNSLDGNWELNYITGPRIAFAALYPDKKPTMKFDLANNSVGGTNSCNQYSGALLITGSKINFKDSKMVVTMMACEGVGESIYMSTLSKIDSYKIAADGKTLNLLVGNVTMMRFSHKPQ